MFAKRRSELLYLLCFLYAAAVACGSCHAALRVGDTFAAADTLAIGEEANPDAKACLDDLSWTPADFTIRLDAAERGCGDFLVHFPSARPLGNTTNDVVSMEWFTAR